MEETLAMGMPKSIAINDLNNNRERNSPIAKTETTAARPLVANENESSSKQVVRF